MKTYNFKSNVFNLIIAFVVIAFASCDKVEGPYKEKQIIVPPDTTISPSDTTYVFETKQSILLEDYTGHQCGNCPEAAEKLEEIKGVYGKLLVPLAVHAGYFAKVALSKFTRNFNTEEGTAYDSYFGISQGAGNPNGMVNRIGWPNGTHIKNLNAWSGIVSSLITKTPDVHLAIKNNYDNSTNSVETKVYVKFKNNLDGNYKLCVLLTEDNIIGPQKDYRITPDYQPNYVFDHVLRASFNSTWGETIATNPLASETNVLRKKYLMSLTGKLFDINHPCDVVAFVYNDLTKEVLQASYQKIK